MFEVCFFAFERPFGFSRISRVKDSLYRPMVYV